MNVKPSPQDPLIFRPFLEVELKRLFLSYTEASNVIADLEVPPTPKQWFQRDYASLLFSSVADSYAEAFTEESLIEFIANVMTRENFEIN